MSEHIWFSKNLVYVYTSRRSPKAYQPRLADIDCSNHSDHKYSAPRPLAKLVKVYTTESTIYKKENIK